MSGRAGISRLFNLAFCEAGISALDVDWPDLLRRHMAGEFEPSPDDRRRFPQTCRHLDRMREEAKAGGRDA